MEREKLLEEYKVTLESLVEKTKFVYSEEFYKLNEFERKKYVNDKMATETHLSTLCNLLWGGKVQFCGGLSDMFALGIIGSMFGGGNFMNPSPSSVYPNKTLDEDEKKNEEQVYTLPVKSN